MATPKKHYFRHDFSCHAKPDFEYLRLKGGSEFYGAYWLLAEKCGISTTDNPSETFIIKREVLRRFLKFSDKKLTKFLDICSKTSEKPLVFVEKSPLSEDSLKITVRKLLIFMNTKPEKGAIDRIGEDKIREDRKGKDIPPKKINEDPDHKHTLEFIKISEIEFQKLVTDHGIDFANRCLEVLDNYKGASGKKYKSDYRAILIWVAKRVQEEMPKQTSQRVSEQGYFKLTLDQKRKLTRVEKTDTSPAYYERKKDEQ